MTPILSRILLVSSDPAWRQQTLAGFSQVLMRYDNPFGLTFSSEASAQQAQHAIEQDGDIQAVLVDDSLQSSHGENAATLLRHLTSYRPELSLYVLLEQEDSPRIAHFAELGISGYFYRAEQDYAGWFRILQAEIADKAATPFFDQLKRYVALAKDAWHTPGHSGGDSLRSSPWVGDFFDFAGEQVLRADLSVSVPMLDSLLHPEGVIAEAQARAARAFGAKQTYFATNGTSTSNKVIFQSLLSPGDILLLDRNCHKSVHHGVILSGAMPVYLDSSVNRRYGVFGPVPKHRILEAMTDYPQAKVLILTSCTYDGLRYDLKPIIAAAHEKGIKVLVDEAWYGHARFHPALRPTALECGADYATQSTHKVLSAFSQASMIHVNDPDFDPHVFRENFNMHASTSPQYSLIASLDVARKQAVMEGYKLLHRTLHLAAELREQINATGVFRVLSLEELLPEEVREDGILLDPCKLTLDISDSGFSADELQEVLFERFNIQIEKSTFNTVTLLLTLGTTRSKVSRLHDAIVRLAKEKRLPRPPLRLPEIPHFSRLLCLPRDAFYQRGERVPLCDENGAPNPALVGQIACDQIVPYPPGIPVLVPGQEITADIIAYLIRLKKAQKHIEVHGLDQTTGEECLRILRQKAPNQAAI